MVAQSYQEIAGISGHVRRVSPEPPRPAKAPQGQQMATAGPCAGGRRTTPYPPEVVFVFEQFALIDAESYQRIYSRKNGKPLAKGYYFVTWTGDRDDRTFGTGAIFHGPFRTRAEAERRLAMFQAEPSPDIRLGQHPYAGHETPALLRHGMPGTAE